MEGFGGLSFEDGGGSIEVGGWDLDAELAALDRRDAALSGAAADDDDAASPPVNWREAIKASGLNNPSIILTGRGSFVEPFRHTHRCD